METSGGNAMSGFTAADRMPLVGLLLVQFFIGYEWLISGLAKVTRGGVFPDGLADELADKAKGTPGWYRGFLEGVAIPNSEAFGYLTMYGELLMGIGLILAALIGLFRWERLPVGFHVFVVVITALATLGGIFLAINLHVANGATHPWLLPGDPFDEGVDLDSVLPAIQAAILLVSVVHLVRMRRAGRRRAGGRRPAREYSPSRTE